MEVKFQSSRTVSGGGMYAKYRTIEIPSGGECIKTIRNIYFRAEIKIEMMIDVSYYFSLKFVLYSFVTVF
jgi:hypothetical protein